nr:integration host factor subunit alpha [uncultured Gammaproteobacteria bacterium]BAL54518.1 integration host factor subunit alpha [uncultured Gammaproteobacteria bacterium]
MTLTKADLVEKLFVDIGLNRKDGKALVDLFFEEIKHALEQGKTVKLSGFGSFDLREKRERPGRNPKTGKEVPVTARRVVTFRAGQKLKNRIEETNAKKPKPLAAD